MFVFGIFHHSLGGSPNFCFISHSSKDMKWQISTPQGAKTPESILMKLGMVDYVRDPTPHDNLGKGSATWVVWANM